MENGACCTCDLGRMYTAPHSTYHYLPLDVSAKYASTFLSTMYFLLYWCETTLFKLIVG